MPLSQPIVDRTYEFEKHDPMVRVILEDGYVARFWIQGLTDEEYIMRAREFQREDNGYSVD